MTRAMHLVVWLLILGSPALTMAGPKEDVAAATQAWADAMTRHDVDRVLALYDSEAVLWGTRSPTLRDNPSALREYFNILRTVPPSYKAVLGEQRVRIYGDIAINTGTYTFSEVRDGKDRTPVEVQLRIPQSRWALAHRRSSLVVRTRTTQVTAEATAAVRVRLSSIANGAAWFPNSTSPTSGMLLVQRYRLLYEVTPTEVQILAFVHGARDLTGPGFEG